MLHVAAGGLGASSQVGARELGSHVMPERLTRRAKLGAALTTQALVRPQATLEAAVARRADTAIDACVAASASEGAWGRGRRERIHA